MNNMRYLGIDYGLKKIGLAIGDDESKIASPFDVIYVIDVIKVIKVIKDLIAEEGIGEIVIGVPKKVGDFPSGAQLEITQNFIKLLKSESGLKVREVDESYTSKESQRLQQEEGATAREDALAAMLILQAFFNENYNLQPTT